MTVAIPANHAGGCGTTFRDSACTSRRVAAEGEVDEFALEYLHAQFGPEKRALAQIQLSEYACLGDAEPATGAPMTSNGGNDQQWQPLKRCASKRSRSMI